MIDAIAKAAVSRARSRAERSCSRATSPATAELAITGGEDGLREVGFEIFRPIFPMLASTAASAAEAVAGFERSSVEWKLDGIRIQIHRRGDEVRIYTRNLNEITDALPGIVEAVRGLPVTQAVFDGEALWMRERGPAAFQDTVSQIDGAAPPEGIVTFLFDVLHARRRGPARHPARGARRAARGDRSAAQDPERRDLGPETRGARARRSAAARATRASW